MLTQVGKTLSRSNDVERGTNEDIEGPALAFTDMHTAMHIGTLHLPLTHTPTDTGGRGDRKNGKERLIQT